jgi:hypothetical protein
MEVPMKKIFLRVFPLFALLATTGLVLAESNDTATLNQIAGYRQWTRVTTQPLEVKPLTISADTRLVGIASPGD